MKKRLPFVLAVALGLSLSAFQSVSQDRPENAEAIAAAMAASEAWAATLNYPHVRVANGGVTVWESAEEFAMGRSFENLARIGWDHSHWGTQARSSLAP